MTPQFSLIIPTRHRPDYVRQALRYAAKQIGDFEVIVADNWIDPALSAKKVFDEAELVQATYVRPPQPLGMVENWNFALQHARGENVLFFTDKNVLLPGALERLAAVIDQHPAELYNWTGDSFTPLNYSRPFAAGFYGKSRAGNGPKVMEARSILERKSSGVTPRDRSSAVEYALGKICFGAYRRSLIDRIIHHCGKLFFPISPDYTSMILGLHQTLNVVDVGWSGVLQINTLISNGLLTSKDDLAAESFLKSVGVYEDLQQFGIAPGLYTSVAANLAFDYVRLNSLFDLGLEIDTRHWLSQAWSEVSAPNRVWSSVAVRENQREILLSAMREVGMPDPTPAPLISIAASDRERSIKSRVFGALRRSAVLSSAITPILSTASRMGLLESPGTRFHRSMDHAILREGAQ
jgi:hypothetical protein